MMVGLLTLHAIGVMVWGLAYGWHRDKIGSRHQGSLLEY